MMRYLIAFLMVILAASSAFSAFKNNDDGTVTDSTTGLTWKQCLEGQTFSAGPPVACTGTATTYTWSQALALTTGGWRLPNIKELQSIVDETKSTLIDTSNPAAGVNPAIDTACFPTPAGVPVSVWSASPYAGTVPTYCPTANSCAWIINFNSGIFQYQIPMSTTLNVRLVKDPL